MVAHLAEKVALHGAIVRESIELIDSNGAPREVDILIESNTGVTSVGIAVECRDRKRRSDIEWIDQVVGKYRDLPAVNKIICVSNSGFSRKAKKKAEKHGIDLLSPQKVSAVDWPAKFRRLGVAKMRFTYQLFNFRVRTEPPWPLPTVADSSVVEVGPNEANEANEEAPSREPLSQFVTDFFQAYREKIVDEARKFHLGQAMSIYKVLADVDKPWIVEITVPVAEMSQQVGVAIALEEGETRSSLREVIFGLLVTCERAAVPIQHKEIPRLGLLSEARYDDKWLRWAQPENAKEVRIYASHVAMAVNSATVSDGSKKKEPLGR